jgi:hypothetical protein
MTTTAKPDRSRWTITRYTDLDEMKADEYRYWRRRPAYERLGAISELARDAYGEEAGSPDVPRLQRPFVRVERE